MRIVVLVKQVPDPLHPVSDLRVSTDGRRIIGPENVPPVVNGYDEQAMEAALRIKEESDGDCEVIAVSAGENFVLDVFQRSLAEADSLVLVKDDTLETSNPHLLARVLAAAIRHIGDVDLVLCGRQASDWDHGQVPLALAEQLGWPGMTLARTVSVDGSRIQVQRVLEDGYQIMECDLPAVLTVTSELGELRYPTMPMRLKAKQRRPTRLGLEDLEVGPVPEPEWSILDLSLLEETRDCQFIGDGDGAAAGRQLAAVLLEEGVITASQANGGA